MLKTIGNALFSKIQNPKFIPGEKQGEDYEVRTYPAARWVSTTTAGVQWDPAISTGFRKLFKYIQGANLNSAPERVPTGRVRYCTGDVTAETHRKGGQQEVAVDMTAPVTCLVRPGAGPACESTFTVSFYIPEELQESPPQPSDDTVFLESREEFTAYVRTYGGFSNEQLQRENLLKLVESLTRDRLAFQDQPYYTAGYDSPFKLTHRRNEVWILKKAEE